VSKFFKALEQAERDRVRQEAQTPGASAPETERAAGPRATPAAAPPIPKEVTPPRSAPAPQSPPPSTLSPTPLAGDRRVDPSSEAGARRGSPAGDRREPARAAAKPRPAVARLDGAEHAKVEEHLVSLLFPATFEAEQYRALRHALELQRAASGLAVVAVTSAAVGDGKTTTAINLAGALAQAPGARVLLVDADLRRPTLARHLGLHGPAHADRPGLVDALLDPRLRLEDLVESCPEFNLAVVPAGVSAQTPYELLQSPRFAELVEEARKHYDYVIIDTPPLVAVPDGRLITRGVDGVLLVVRAHGTPRKLVEEALDLADPKKLLGLVYNRDDRPLSGYYRRDQGRDYYGASLLPRNGDGRGRFARLLRRGRRNGTG
jgi:capsular exopolysaccharide synthesis family protein